MFQLFKDCIAHPRRIAEYVDRPNKKFIGFFIILILLYIFPIMLIVSTTNTLPSYQIDDMSQAFYVADDLHYEIKDGVLVSEGNQYGTEYVQTKIILQNNIFDLAYVFDLTESNFHVDQSLDSESFILCVFHESKLKIYIGSKSLKGVSDDSKIGIYEKTYKELGITNIQFNDCKGRNYYDFSIQFTGLANSLFKSVKNRFLPLLIISMIFTYSLSYVILLLGLALLELLFYKQMGLKYGEIFKICAYSSTPYLILSFIGTLTGLSFLGFIGQLILIIYAMKALSTYAILKHVNKL